MDDIIGKLIEGDKLRVVQQGLPSVENIADKSINTFNSLSDKIRKSLDNLKTNHQTKVYGVIATMIFAGGALTSSLFNSNAPITVVKDNTTIDLTSNTASNASNAPTLHSPNVNVVNSGNEIKSTSIFESLQSNIKATANNNTPSFPILKTSHGRYKMSDELKTSIEEAAKFSVPAGMKDNQISRFVSKAKFKSAMEKGTPQDFLSALMSEGEGFRGNLYRDNIGLAYGIGWNVSMQNKDFNQFLMGAVNNNPEAIKQITSFSSSPIAYPAGKYGTDETIMPVQRHLQASLLIADTFKNEGVYKGLEKHVRNIPEAKNNSKNGSSFTEQTKKAFASLDPNIQGALIYHSYKVGSAGYGKYNTLNQKVAEYAFTPIEKRTIQQRREIADSISYTYKYNGEVLRDTRAEVKVAAMIANPEAFGFLIKSNPAPLTIKDDIPQLNKNKISVPTNPNQEMVIPDPLGEAKAKALAENKNLDFKIYFNPNELNIDNIVKPKPQGEKRPKRGVPHYW